MKATRMGQFILLIFVSFFPCFVFAWNNSIEFGYGYSHDPNNVRYHNSALVLSGDFIPLYRSYWTFWSIGGALSQWYTSAPQDKKLTAAALTLGLRFYPFDTIDYQTYFLASAGPAVLSSRYFGVNTQACNFTIQSNVGFGVEFDPIDVNLRFAHYSNAGLGKPNEGFNIIYLLSIGYLF